MPLLITDDSGNLVYKSRAYSKNAAAFSLAVEDTVVSKNGNAAFRKDVRIDGKVYHFYLQTEWMHECFGLQAATVADRLFDVSHMCRSEPITLSLSVLTHLLSARYVAPLRASGVHLELRKLDHPWGVKVLPDALLLCIALMVRLCACHGKKVQLSAVRTHDRVTVFADAAIGEGIAEVPAVLSALLSELAAAAGFAVGHSEKNGTVTWSLELSPVDIGMFGFKVDLLDELSKAASLYAELWL